MVLYILTGYQVLGIAYLNQLSGAHHTHISYHNRGSSCLYYPGLSRPGGQGRTQGDTGGLADLQDLVRIARFQPDIVFASGNECLHTNSDLPITIFLSI